MYNVFIYQTANGNCPVINYLEKLEYTSPKDRDFIESRIRYLKMCGLKILENDVHAKSLGNNIYELRYKRYRILFTYINNDSFILLHIFLKEGKPQQIREIKKAIKEAKALNQNEVFLIWGGYKNE